LRGATSERSPVECLKGPDPLFRRTGAGAVE
jgi:hypothetical protein